MSESSDNEKYKLIVIFGTVLFLIWAFASFQQEVSGFSTVLGFIIGPILAYFFYKIIKAIWPDLF